MARLTEQGRQILHRYSRPGAADLTQQEIGDELARNRSTINGHIRRLIQLGYLVKIGHGQYDITPSGRSALERGKSAAAKFTKCPDCGRRIYL